MVAGTLLTDLMAAPLFEANLLVIVAEAVWAIDFHAPALLARLLDALSEACR